MSRCSFCQGERSQGHCWNLCCPTYSGSMQLLAWLRGAKPTFTAADYERLFSRASQVDVKTSQVDVLPTQSELPL